jgi:hypothetical protein
MDYLRNRPFLIIEYASKPAVGQKPHLKDFGKTAEWEVTEIPSIVTRIGKRHEIEAHVILDLFNKKVIKNRFSKDEPEVVYAHFYTKYQEEIDKVVESHQKVLAAKHPPVVGKKEDTR